MVLTKGFNFDGKVKKYLTNLPFVEARAVFMVRARMLPTKSNFKGRQKMERYNYCVICGKEETEGAQRYINEN